MIVHAEGGHATMTEAEDLKALSLVIYGPRQLAVGQWGTWVDDGHLAVRPAFLVELAGTAAESPAWQDDFRAMIAYATSQGWVDDEGRVRMHVAAQ